MEPQAAPAPEQGPKLPKPESSPPSDNVEAGQPTQEKLAPRGETAGQSMPAPPSVNLPKPIKADGDAKKAAQEPPKVVDNTTVGPAVADDVDVIEKEWVDKAKSIVDEHKHDPYNQEKETSKLQADYLKKRYGKDVKLSP